MMMGWVCTYTPEEIFTALEMESYRLCGADNQAVAMRYLPVNLCPMARSCLDEAAELRAAAWTPAPRSNGSGELRLKRQEHELSGVVLAASCHALVHLANAFQHAWGGDGFFVHLLDLPHTCGMANESAALAFASGLRDLALKLSAHCGRPWEDSALTGAIQLHQSVRELLREIFRMRQQRPEEFRAAALLELVRHAGRSRKQDLLPELQGLVELLRSGRVVEGLVHHGSPLGPRLLVTGSPLPLAYLDLIEELGGIVAGDDLCQGYRYCLPEVAESGDPFLSLARGYLERIPCPRMLAGSLRFAYLQEQIEGLQAQGVVYHALKFCDLYLYEYALLRSRLATAGIPVLYLETEYRDVGLEQARTRLQAFLELLGTCEARPNRP